VSAQLLVRFRVALVAASCAAICACAKAPVQEAPPPPVQVAIAVDASANANPDSEGRPSPVTVRIYQLADSGKFQQSEFFTLWDGDAQALGPALLGRIELQVAPGKHADGALTLEPAARSIGVAAAFRDFRGASWRNVVPVSSAPRERRQLKLVITVGANTVTAAVQ
jgi:type VI secretion system protein VasD